MNIELTKDTPDLLNQSVDLLELGVRTSNCFTRANILTIGELTERSEADLMKIRDFGRRSLKEVRGTLDDFGLSLKGPPYVPPMKAPKAQTPMRVADDLAALRRKLVNVRRFTVSLIREIDRLDAMTKATIDEIRKPPEVA